MDINSFSLSLSLNVCEQFIYFILLLLFRYVAKEFCQIERFDLDRKFQYYIILLENSFHSDQIHFYVMAGHKIKLQSSDGDTFDVEVEIAKQSATIKTMLEGQRDVFVFFFLSSIENSLEDLGMDEEEDVIPLPNVNSAILKKVNDFSVLKFENEFFFQQVIQWATHHKDDPPPPEDDENREKNTNDISSWDQDFLKVDQGTLFELILVRTSIPFPFFNDALFSRLLIIQISKVYLM